MKLLFNHDKMADDRKMVGLKLQKHLNDWCFDKGVEKFGRKNSKSDFIRSLIVDAYEKDMRGK